MPDRLVKFYREHGLFYTAWVVFANVTTVLVIAAALTLVVLEWALPDRDQPVVIVEDFKLLTPRVPVGGAFTFQVNRKSTESCPGAGVVAYTKKATNPNEPTVVVSTRFPLGTPGYNSPPPLTVTRPVPAAVGKGVWNVKTGVDSFCPTRTRYDPTGEFELEVYDD